MKKKLPLLAFAFVFTLILAACATQAATVSPQPLSTEVPATKVQSSAGSTAEISLVNFSFSPKELTIKKGTTITWTNEDSAVHTVTSDTDVFASGNLAKGDTFSYTFTTAGTFPYHCIPHKANMTGTIVVTD